MFKHIGFLGMALASILTVRSFAVPPQINYQGQLTSSSGTALDTTVSMTFKLYNDSTGGSLLWTETWSSVSVASGLFNVRLGQLTPLDPAVLNQAQLWLGLTVGADLEMSPRTRIVSVGYSYRVGTVDGATGGTITGDVTVNGKGNIGSGNINSGTGAFVTGTNNRARGDYSVVAGGGGGWLADSNSANSAWATVSGGRRNIVAGGYGTVSGGLVNSASNDFSTVSGGTYNVAAGNQGTISGGSENTVSNAWATVGGGGYNTASGAGSTVCGGGHNIASGTDATVGGGESNRALGAYSFACGYRARANHNYAFVWGGSNDATDSTASTIDYSFTARCPYGALFYTSFTGTSTGVALPVGGGAWNTLCNVRQKNLHGEVNTSEILQKVASLPLYRWSYKSQNDGIQHVGPSAQDFYAAFHLGDSDTTISTLDPDGVALAAIQELAKEDMKQDEEIHELRAMVQSLLADKKQSGNVDRKEK